MKPKPQNLFPPGRIHAVSVSDRKGVVKHNVDQARLVVEHGLAGDAHAEGGIRQVSLLARESIDKMVAAGAKVKPGDFAENLTVEGLEVMSLPVGTNLSFTPTGSSGVPTIGIGTMRFRDAQWEMENQMSTNGGSGTVSHWAYMVQCKAGQSCMNSLPGTSLTFSQLLSACS